MVLLTPVPLIELIIVLLAILRIASSILLQLAVVLVMLRLIVSSVLLILLCGLKRLSRLERLRAGLECVGIGSEGLRLSILTVQT